MEYEYHFSVRIFTACEKNLSTPKKIFSFEGFDFVLSAVQSSGNEGYLWVSLLNPEDNPRIPEEVVSGLCQKLSQDFHCRVEGRKGWEKYGNTNVFNGGSDYEVVEEKWFYSTWENGAML
ncbi:MAG: hypothetical protein HUK21_08520 [Fibrobacteraceae bacterium]|nr:hypothetical protein [Fibrobacteraceae bacterium]